MDNTFVMEGAQNRRGSSVLSQHIPNWVCACGRSSPHHYALHIQLGGVRAPFTGRLCKECFAQLLDDSDGLENFSIPLAAAYLDMDTGLSQALHERLKLRPRPHAPPVRGDTLN